MCVRGCAGVGVGERERLRACVRGEEGYVRACVCACMFVYL